jgi:hypothetical protein
MNMSRTQNKSVYAFDCGCLDTGLTSEYGRQQPTAGIHVRPYMATTEGMEASGGRAPSNAKQQHFCLTAMILPKSGIINP